MSATPRSVSQPQDGTINLRGTTCALHTWQAVPPDERLSPPPRGIAVIYHGFLAHGTYPTVRYAAELLSSNNYHVVSADLPGHGQSPGLRGYLPSSDELVEDGVAIARHAAADGAAAALKASQGAASWDGDDVDLPLFLVGSSMGGTIALAVAMELESSSSTSDGQSESEGSGAGGAAPLSVRGVVLLAPMLALNVATPLRHVLRGLAFVLPTVPIIPSSSTSAEKQYRDADRRKECEDDPLSVDTGGYIMPASASTCVELAHAVGGRFGTVTVPFLCMVAREDVVVDNAGSRRLLEEAKSTDKTLREYDALHGLLCEPKPLVDEIHRDLLAWMDERCPSE